MPNDGHGEGTFTPEDDINQHHYRLQSWVKLGDYPNRREDIETRDLPEVDFTVVAVWRDDPSDVQYDTVWGPFDNWKELEEYLAYDFGEDGSLPSWRVFGP